MKQLMIILSVLLCPVFGAQAIPADTETEILIKEKSSPSGPLRSAPAPAVSAWLTNR
jgi:hypothetical protein